MPLEGADMDKEKWRVWAVWVSLVFVLLVAVVALSALGKLTWQQAATAFGGLNGRPRSAAWSTPLPPCAPLLLLGGTPWRQNCRSICYRMLICAPATAGATNDNVFYQ